jgi:hypothetical protein
LRNASWIIYLLLKTITGSDYVRKWQKILPVFHVVVLKLNLDPPSPQKIFPLNSCGIYEGTYLGFYCFFLNSFLNSSNLAESNPDESDIRRFWQSPIKTRPTEDEVDVDSMTVRSLLGCEGTKKREKSLDYDYQFVNSISISIF